MGTQGNTPTEPTAQRCQEHTDCIRCFVTAWRRPIYKGWWHVTCHGDHWELQDEWQRGAAERVPINSLDDPLGSLPKAIGHKAVQIIDDEGLLPPGCGG